MKQSLNIRKIASKLLTILVIIVAVYLVIGVGFHAIWQTKLDACREARIVQGETVDPEVLGGALGFVLDVTGWPYHMSGNMKLSGSPFSTPCTH
ncbi:MAG: hypothetical protein WA110_00945 [Anaerolineaceae bacterium]